MKDTTGKVYFAIKSEDERLELTQFEKYITLKPTRFEKMFARLTVPKCTIWKFGTPKLVNAHYFNEIESLMDVLVLHKQEFINFRNAFPEVELVLQVVIYVGDETPALHFSQRAIAFANAVGAPIDCDIY